VTSQPPVLAAAGRPRWLRDADELPHAPDDVPLWCENYLTYLYAPAAGVGVWTHMCHRGGPPERWDEKVLVALPGDRYLAAKAIGPGYPDNGPRTCGLALRCEEPYRRWTMRFDGDARLLTRNELHSGPVADGEHVSVELALDVTAIGPAYDFGEQHLDQAWGHGHYEQPLSYVGTLSVAGEAPIELTGTGLRDHSWGPRDYAQIGSTAWIHGQFPRSGRTFMAVAVTGNPPRPALIYAVTGNAGQSTPASVGPLPTITDAGNAGDGYEVTLNGSVLKAEILDTVRMAFVGATEIALGRHRTSRVNHDYLISFTRFEWDGEVGYGVTDRTVELTNHTLGGAADGNDN
jgi:hypothetical protein